MADVRIGEVRIDIDVADDGEAAFARLFQRYMRMWSAQQEVAARNRRAADDERTLFDRKHGS